MNRLVKILAGCDLRDVSSLRALSNNNEGNIYYFEDIRVMCEETHRATPDIVRFTISVPMDMLFNQLDEDDWGIVVADYSLRNFVRLIQAIRLERTHDTKKEKFTGKILIHEPNNKVLLRNSAYVRDGMLHFTLKIKFPVHMMEKRNVVNGSLSVRIVRKELARAIRAFITEFDDNECMERIAVYKRQCELRQILCEKGYVGFIANGSMLPRQEFSEMHMEGAVPFASPQEDEVTFTLRDGTTLTGMVIKQGVTVITGGGYSGKSTLLNAVLNGIYDHIPGDGREYCITEQRCYKIIAEDGRHIHSLDVTPFIRNMPGIRMSDFSTIHASGSTSQAANIMESIAFGCKLLLIDEDRTATNFMIRDSRMKKLIQNDPIIPFTDRARQLYREAGVSTVLIIGGSSEYLDIADSVYFMENYRIYNFNEEAECHRLQPYEYYEVRGGEPVRWRLSRTLAPDTMTSFTRNVESGKYKEYMKIDGTIIKIGDIMVDISRIESIISAEQVNAIAWICRYIAAHSIGRSIDLEAEVNSVYEKIYREGFRFMLSLIFDISDVMELPHPVDVMAAVSRMSLVEFCTQGGR